MLPLLVAGVTFLAFLPALSNRLVAWDDQRTIVENVHIHGVTWDNVRWMFTHFHMGHYQPLALLTLAIDYDFWGLEPFGFHLTNVLVHTLSAVVFYLLTRRLLFIAQPHWAAHPGLLSIGAAISALLFSTHPLRVESVAWATERRDVLSALFFLLAVLAYVIAHERRRAGAGAGSLMACALLAMAVSLLAKMIAAMLVPVLLVLDVYPLRRLGPPRTWLGRGTRPVLLEKIPFAVLASIMIVVAPLAQSKSGAWAGLEPHGLLARACGALFALSFYLWKTVWPFGLSPLYEMPESASRINPAFVMGGVLVLLSGPAVLVWRRRWSAFLSAWAFYLILLLPVLGVFQSWPQIAADRYTYLSCLGWMLLIGGGAARLVERRATLQPLLIGISTVVVLGLCVRTWQQNAVWSDTVQLWAHALMIDPEGRIATANYGAALLTENRIDEAIVQFDRALRQSPHDSTYHANMGLALVRKAQSDEAMKSFQRAVELDERNHVAHAGLGVLLYKRGDLDAAARALERSLVLDPDSDESHGHYANVLRKRGQTDAAVAQYREAIRLGSQEWKYRQALAETLIEAARVDDGIAVLRAARAKAPGDPRPLNALARILATAQVPAARRPAEAVELASMACRLTEERVPEYLDTLAVAHAANGEFDRAVAVSTRACALAEKAGLPDMIEICRRHLAMFQNRQSAPAN